MLGITTNNLINSANNYEAAKNSSISKTSMRVE